jgi:hypothetical protein
VTEFGPGVGVVRGGDEDFGSEVIHCEGWEGMKVSTSGK